MVLDEDILNAKILIVDDHLVNISLLEKMLEQAGYKHIFSTSDSRQVQSLYFQHDIDLILLDLRMPYLDGFEVMAQLQEAIDNDYLPVLVLTAELTSQAKVKALGSGAKDFLTKPFVHFEVLQRIKNILEVRLLHKQIRGQNEMLERKVCQRTHELEQSRLEIIQRLSHAAEYKDNETGTHILRMSKFAQLLAQASGLPAEQTENILLAAPMHDIGKIGIPDYILLKPGKLDPDEWKIMQSHVTIGADLLGDSDVPLLVMAKNIALTHHEKWDGSGYPNQLAGDEIPIEGRIASICDVFDALISERPYKKAWPVEQAMQFLHSQKGKHFDQLLISKFDSILTDVLAYRDTHMDSHPKPYNSR